LARAGGSVTSREKGARRRPQTEGTAMTTLAALLRRVSRMAERTFDKQGDVDPLWLIENADGEQTGLITPIITSTPLAAAEEKDRIAAEVRTLFAEKGIVRYACAMEVWKLAESAQQAMTKEQRGLQYAAMGYTLANHPDRREAVVLNAEDGAEALTAFRDIIRPPHGKPYLGKLGAIERIDSVESRWLGLLPSAAHAAALRERPPTVPELKPFRLSKDLSDDVGTVFVTNVAGAPLQLTGRRDPANGELCVGLIVGPGKDAPWPPPVALAWVEIVTGPEAERLILSVHGYLTAQADAAGLTFEEYMQRDDPGPAP
jgi:hypothetical protein